MARKRPLVRWRNELPESHDFDDALAFIRAKFEPFDLSRVVSIQFRLTKKKNVLTSTGLCVYPSPNQPKHRRGYTMINRISSRLVHPRKKWPIEETFMVDMGVLRTVIEMNEGVAAKTPNPPEPSLVGDFANTSTKSVYERCLYETPGEVLVLVAGHEAFHFLRDSGQVPGRNTEPQANAFGVEWMNEYRNL